MSSLKVKSKFKVKTSLSLTIPTVYRFTWPTIPVRYAFRFLASRIFIVLALLTGFQRFLEKATGIGAFSKVDELMLVFVLGCFFLLGMIRSRLNGILVMTTLLLSYIVVISLLFGVNKSIPVILLQGLVHLKFFFFISFVMVFFEPGDRLIRRSFRIFVMVAVAGYIFQLLSPTLFQNLFNVIPNTRRGELRYGGIIHTNQFSLLLSSIYIIWLARNFHKSSWRKVVAYALLFSLLIMINGSRTALVGVVLPVFILYRRQIFTKRVMRLFLFAGALGFILVYTSTDLIQRTATNVGDMFNPESKYIRGILIYYGVVLSIWYFPIGSGAATYGSLLSANSVIYDQLGIGDNYYIVNEKGTYDSNFASIMGEFGVLGFLLFYLLLRKLFRRLKNTMHLQAHRQLMHAIYVVIFFYLVSNPIFMNSLASLIFVWVLSIIVLNVNEDVKQADRLS